MSTATTNTATTTTTSHTQQLITFKSDNELHSLITSTIISPQLLYPKQNMNGINFSQANNGYGTTTASSANNDSSNNQNELNAVSSESNQQQQQSSSTVNDTTTGTQNTDSNNNAGGAGTDDVCRDFLRNVCRRGKSCRYKHPDANESELMKKEQYVFCHDFQNRECRRENCRFLHCTKQEEIVYRSTGRLPAHIIAQVPLEDRNSAPICKDFLNGTCRRGPRCKYRHPIPQDSFQHSSPSNRNGPFDGRNGRGGVINYPNSPHSLDYKQPHYGRPGAPGGNPPPPSSMMPSTNYGYDYSDLPNKRKRYDPYYENGPYSGAYNEPPPPPAPMGANPPRNAYELHSPTQSYAGYGARLHTIDSRSYLEEENSALRRRIDDLKKQVSELLSTNELLVEQLNQLRASSAAAAAAACGANTVSTLKAQQAPGSVSSNAAVGMSAPLTLQAQVAPQQAAAVALGPLPPPVSIVSSIAPISLPTVSAPVTLVNSSAAASLASFTPSMHSSMPSNPWPLGVDQ